MKLFTSWHTKVMEDSAGWTDRYQAVLGWKKSCRCLLARQNGGPAAAHQGGGWCLPHACPSDLLQAAVAAKEQDRLVCLCA